MYFEILDYFLTKMNIFFRFVKPIEAFPFRDSHTVRLLQASQLGSPKASISFFMHCFFFSSLFFAIGITQVCYVFNHEPTLFEDFSIPFCLQI